MTTHTLQFRHWKHGRVTCDVDLVGSGAGGRIRYVKDRATLWLIAESGNVFNAGRVIDGVHTYSAPVHVGWDATVTNVLSEGYYPRCRHPNYITFGRRGYPRQDEDDGPFCPDCDAFVDL